MPKTSVEGSSLLYIHGLPLGFECSQSSEILLRLLVSVLKKFPALDFLLNRRDPGLWSVAPRLSLNPLDVGLYLLVSELGAAARIR